jgi:hypothetical protein
MRRRKVSEVATLTRAVGDLDIPARPPEYRVGPTPGEVDAFYSPAWLWLGFMPRVSIREWYGYDLPAPFTPALDAWDTEATRSLR